MKPLSPSTYKMPLHVPNAWLTLKNPIAPPYSPRLQTSVRQRNKNLILVRYVNLLPAPQIPSNCASANAQRSSLQVYKQTILQTFTAPAGVRESGVRILRSPLRLIRSGAAGTPPIQAESIHVANFIANSTTTILSVNNPSNNLHDKTHYKFLSMYKNLPT